MLRMQCATERATRAYQNRKCSHRSVLPHDTMVDMLENRWIPEDMPMFEELFTGVEKIKNIVLFYCVALTEKYAIFCIMRKNMMFYDELCTR